MKPFNFCSERSVTDLYPGVGSIQVFDNRLGCRLGRGIEAPSQAKAEEVRFRFKFLVKEHRVDMV